MDIAKMNLESARYEFLNSLPILVRVVRDLKTDLINAEALADAAHDTILKILQEPR